MTPLDLLRLAVDTLAARGGWAVECADLGGWILADVSDCALKANRGSLRLLIDCVIELAPSGDPAGRRAIDLLDLALDSYDAASAAAVAVRCGLDPYELPTPHASWVMRSGCEPQAAQQTKAECDCDGCSECTCDQSCDQNPAEASKQSTLRALQRWHERMGTYGK